MRKIVITTVWALLLAGIGSLFVFANKKQGTETCRSLNVMIEYNGADPLIDESYLIKLITKEGIRIKGQPLKSIPAIAIEELLNNDPYISKSSVRIGVDGIVNIFAKQRIPLVKIVSDNGKTFYLDMEGAVMPLNPGFPARVMVATGHIKAHVPAKEKVRDRMNTEPKGLLSTELQK
ncbi:MAG: hypothetical protein PHX54_07775, partial [Lentimicrobiaceae bacterium]|nr:hypothetical protein [Lentimicrobiaceae bacterium]